MGALDRARREADQRETHVADRGIGHQPLDAGLPDRRERAQRHRGDRDEGDDLPPFAGRRPERPSKSPAPAPPSPPSSAPWQEGRHRRRRALIDVGRPHVERHRRDLEGQTGQHEDQAEHHAERRRPFSAAAMPVEGDRARKSHRSAIAPYSSMPEDSAPRTKYLSAGLGRAHVVAVDTRRPRRAPGSSVRARDTARSDRWPRSACIMPSVASSISTGNSKPPILWRA